MRVFAIFMTGMAAALAVGWLAFPNALYQAEQQPLQFNHLVHKVKAEMACDTCHEIAKDGQFAGIPKLENCAGCHAEVQGKTEAEKQLVKDFVTPQREIPWKVYARQPMNVRFSHSVHVKQGKLACERCHGKHGDSTAISAYYRNRVSGESQGVWGPRMVRVGLRPGEGMKMADCEGCHAERQVSASCLGCHR